jgi:putative tryptophan/tyrosine transport system permease protein
MGALVIAVLTQSLTFLPLALGISISFTLLRATDMTLDGSFVLGAAIFARLVTLGFSPVVAALCALLAGALAGVMVSLIQKGGRVDPLLAGILATFILTSGNLALMGRPNINLLSVHTLVSDAFAKSNFDGWMVVAAYCSVFCLAACLLIRTRFGLMLRALGDNPSLLQRLGNPVELYRMAGFALTNALAAVSGILTAQTVGYADVGMGFGMTLTGIGAIILGQQIFRVLTKSSNMRVLAEFFACLIGVLLYFFAINSLLRFDIDPVYLKMILGIVLILFLRTAVNPSKQRNLS